MEVERETHQVPIWTQNGPAEAKAPEVRIVGKGGTKGKARVFAQLQQNLCLGVGTFYMGDAGMPL